MKGEGSKKINPFFAAIFRSRPAQGRQESQIGTSVGDLDARPGPHHLRPLALPMQHRHPPPNLRLAVLGRAASGKTLLMRHLQAVWPAPPSVPAAPPPRRPPNALVARLVSSRLSALVQRFVRTVLSARRLLPERPACAEVALAGGGRAWVGVGEDGAAAVKRAAPRLDAVLFVTRLDDGRLSRRDRLVLHDVLQHLGRDALHKLVFVLTHGCATAPAGLPFGQFVRGRTDLLRRFVVEVMPPIEVLPEEQAGAEEGDEAVGRPARDVRRAGEGDSGSAGGRTSEDRRGSSVGVPTVGNDGAGATAATANGAIRATENLAELESSQHEYEERERGAMSVNVGASGLPTEGLRMGRRAVSAAASEVRERAAADVADANSANGPGARDAQQSAEVRRLREQLDELVHEDSSDSGSLSALPADVIGALYTKLVHPEDTRSFRDPHQPDVVVVELSGACSRNAAGEKVLPDGRAWMGALVDVVCTTAEEARLQERVAHERELRALAMRSPVGFWGKLREMMFSLFRDRARMWVVELLALALLLQAGAAAKRRDVRRERQRKEAERADVLLEMSEEEYQKAVAPDKDGGRTALSFQNEDDSTDGLDENLFDDLRQGKVGRSVEIRPDGARGIPNWVGK